MSLSRLESRGSSERHTSREYALREGVEPHFLGLATTSANDLPEATGGPSWIPDPKRIVSPVVSGECSDFGYLESPSSSGTPPPRSMSLSGLESVGHPVSV